MDKPLIKSDDPLYALIRDGKIDEFNAAKQGGTQISFINCDFRNVDLRGIDASGIDFSGCYFRQADLRAIDFSQSNLEGASINGAMISGTFFPKRLLASEIELSLVHGTRMRYT